MTTDLNVPLERLQADCTGYLLSQSWFDDIEVINVRSADADSKIEAALQGTKKKNNKCGVAVAVRIPLLDADSENIPGPQFKIKVPIVVVEIPEINHGTYGTGKSGEEVALRVLQSLHHYCPSSDVQTLVIDKEPLTPEVRGVKLFYELKLAGNLRLVPLAKVTAVTITNAAGNITLACAGTASTSIYYTTNGSFPRSGNGTLYSAPFATPASGTVIRAAAYKTNYVGSDIAELEI